MGLSGTVAKLGAVLRIAIPAAVAADTVYSFYRVSQLYRQRLQEWAEEEAVQVHTEVVQALRQVVHQCGKKDKDFWPAVVTAAFTADTCQANIATGSTPSLHGTDALLAGLPGRGEENSCSSLPLVDERSAAEPSVSEQALSPATIVFQCLGLGSADLEEAAPLALSLPPPSAVVGALTETKASGSTTALPLARASGEAASLTAADPAGPAAEAGPLLRDPYSPTCTEDAAAVQGTSTSNKWLAWLPSWVELKGLGVHAVAAVKALGQPREAALSLHSSLGERYRHQCSLLDAGLSTAAKALRQRLETRVPWPRAEVQRR
ncbi:hypothetical protein N2152v2_002371 [Parachlorella kessleri]